MDDPWGSSWAGNDASLSLSSTSSSSRPPTLLLSPPPRAFVLPLTTAPSVTPTLFPPWEKTSDSYTSWPRSSDLASPAPNASNPWASSMFGEPSPKTPRHEAELTLSTWRAVAGKPLPSLESLPGMSSASSTTSAPTLSRQSSFGPSQQNSPVKSAAVSYSSSSQRVSSTSTLCPAAAHGVPRPALAASAKRIAPARLCLASESSVSRSSVAHESVTAERSQRSSKYSSSTASLDSPPTSAEEYPKHTLEKDLANGTGGWGTCRIVCPQEISVDKQNMSREKAFYHAAAARKLSNKPAIDVSTPLNLLDELFATPATQCAASAVSERADSCVLDTASALNTYHAFHNDSERRMWFRVSRAGSMLRTKASDVKAFVSPPWHATKIHAETLTTVKQWMDSQSLGTFRAAGPVTTVSSQATGFTDFGWESPTPTISMKDIFGRQRKVSRENAESAGSAMLRHNNARTLPQVSPPMTPHSPGFDESASNNQLQMQASRRRYSTHRPEQLDLNVRSVLHKRQTSKPLSIHSPGPITPQSATDFGWGSLNHMGQNATSTVESHAVVQAGDNVPKHNDNNVNLNSGSCSASKDNGLAHPDVCSAELHTTTAVVEHGVNLEQDEWGDMVSSPSLDTWLVSAAGSLTVSDVKKATSTPAVAGDGVLSHDDLSTQKAQIDEIANNLPNMLWMLQ